MKRLKGWAVGLALALLLALFALQYLYLERILAHPADDAVTLAIAVIGVGTFSFVLWRLIERAEGDVRRAYEAERRQAEQLEALSAAALSLTADLDVESVLQKVVDLSRRVISARYGAMAVLGPGGVIDDFFTSGIDPAQRARLGPPPTGHGLIGAVISERRPLRVDDIATDPRSVGFPASHPPMRTLLAVPMMYGDEVTGSLYLTERDDSQPFDANDQRLLERFAAQASIAVANARLYATAQRVSVVEERERIAMDLHDGVIQSIYGASLAIQANLDRLATEPEAAREELDSVVDRLDQVIMDIRGYVQGLRGQQQRDDGFVQLLNKLLDSLAAGPELQRQLITHGDFGDVARRQQWELWHVTHEALSNAVRHGHPQRIDVYLTREDGRVRLAIQDNGEGFDPEAAAALGHDGLANMRRRVADMGGHFVVLSAPGRGTTVVADVPILAGGEHHDS